ncbi:MULTISPECIES: ABC transporter ATP-binding protein [Paenibacillus]|uniref:ABC transporter ATP-binding protein n=1 Tax=Paenibacillus TaxID=44249 RepID=UPI0007BFB5AE|nr:MULTISPECIES: ABC transporter ATP-binding protein [Paenibacillus]WDQ30742.1 ABC transporter ATP-binding protein [Paenibacillus marchantiae]SEA50686.1 sulfonate transport system ATP-binding protein [Paenibacillus sp. 276b]SEL49725.1 sulfonate transport system ATP-binding protein [Paenibacillus sp. OK003]
MSGDMLMISDLNKTFVAPVGEIIALNNIQLKVRKGELVTIIGPSGCGKSTLLKIVAGLDTQYTGTVLLNGKPIAGPSIEKGFIFQEPRLFPWLTVEKNIAANLSLRDPVVRRKVEELIELVRLKGFEKSYPRELSGGMAQRVAIARALLRNPDVLLLDEPFGALDAFTRSHLQEVLLDIWQRNGTTMLFVTHDLDEAVFLGERVVIMNPRPGHIRSILSIDLPFPRKRSSSAFQEMRRLVLNEFEKVDEPLYDVGGGI